MTVLSHRQDKCLTDLSEEPENKRIYPFINVYNRLWPRCAMHFVSLGNLAAVNSPATSNNVFELGKTYVNHYSIRVGWDEAGQQRGRSGVARDVQPCPPRHEYPPT